MGRREQRERDKRKAAAICCTIEKFLPAKKSCTETSASTSQVCAEQESCSSTSTSLLQMATTLDADQQSSSNTDLLCEVTSKEQMDDTELLINSDSEGQVRTDCNSLTAIKNLPKDFGMIYSCSKVPNDFIVAIQRLTSTERYSLLKHHEVPPCDHIFPVSSFGKSNRKFKPKWLTQNTWMVYSTACS